MGAVFGLERFALGRAPLARAALEFGTVTPRVLMLGFAGERLNTGFG